MFTRLKVMKKLNKEACTWECLLGVIGDNAKLYNAIKFLKSNGYIEEEIACIYSIAYKGAFRKYIHSIITPVFELIGFIGGTLAILQLLCKYCIK